MAVCTVPELETGDLVPRTALPTPLSKRQFQKLVVLVALSMYTHCTVYTAIVLHPSFLKIIHSLVMTLPHTNPARSQSGSSRLGLTLFLLTSSSKKLVWGSLSSCFCSRGCKVNLLLTDWRGINSESGQTIHHHVTGVHHTIYTLCRGIIIMNTYVHSFGPFIDTWCLLRNLPTRWSYTDK